MSMSETEDREAIRAFLAKHVRIEGIENDANLFDIGLITSLFAIQVVRFVEKRARCEVPDEMLTREAFASVDAIAVTLAALRGGQ